MGGERPPGEEAPAGGWLPPAPPGPEPDLGERAPRAEEQTTTQGWAPPAEAQPRPAGHPGQPPPAPQQAYAQPPGYGYQPQPAQPPQPPTPQQQLGWGQPPPPTWQQAQPPPGLVAQQQPTSVPTNGAAVAGFVLSVSAIGLLVTTFGFLWPATLVGAIVGIVYSRKGKAAVREGRTTAHGQLAQAGFVIGIVALVLSLLAVAGCAAILADSDLRNDLDGDPGDPGGGFNSVVVVTRSLAAGLGL